MMRRVLGINIFGHDSNRIEGIGEYVSPGAVPFLGRYRCIDFNMSSMANSGIDEIGLFVKEKPKSIVEHIDTGRQYNMNTKRGGIMIFFAPDGYSAMTNYLTDISTLYFNKFWLEREDKDYVVVTSGNYIYSFDYSLLLEKHIESKADITVMYKEVNNANKAFINCDVIDINRQNGVKTIYQNQGNAAKKNIMMGCYVMKKDIFLGLIDQAYHTSRLYWIRDILNDACDYLDVRAYKFDGYLGCINSFKSYFDTSMELLDIRKRNSLFKEDWLIYTQTNDSAPTLYRDGGVAKGGSLISNGCLICGEVDHSIVGRRVNIGKGTTIKNSIIFPDVEIGENMHIENAVIDKYASVTKVKDVQGSVEQPIYIHRGDTI